MLQTKSQLRSYYGYDGQTIIGNCDTYVYLGSNDIATSENIAKQVNRPLIEVLHMPVGTNWVLRRGEMPVHGKNFKLEPFRRAKMEFLAHDTSERL